MSDNEIVTSKLPSDNSYGQNGYQGASSLTPGQTKSDAAITRKPNAVLDHVKANGARYEASPIEQPLAASFGHRDRNSESVGSIPTATDHRK